MKKKYTKISGFCPENTVPNLTYLFTSNFLNNNAFLKKKSIDITKTILFVMLFCFFSSFIHGATITSYQTGNWSSASTWVGGVVPSSLDDVVIAQNDQITVNGSYACLSLTLNGNNSFLIFDSGSSLTVNGSVTVTGNNNEIVMSSGGTLTCQGFINNASKNFIFTAGTGTVELTANNTLPTTSYSTFNKLIISSGTTTLGSITNSTASGNLTIRAGATLALDKFTYGATTPPTELIMECGASIGSSLTGTGILTLGGNITINNVATGIAGALISSRIALGADAITFLVANDGTTAVDLTISGAISGGYSITKTGSGTLQLSGNSTYSGTTTISEGILQLASGTWTTGQPLGSTTSGTIVNSGAVLDLNGQSLPNPEPLTLNGTGISGSGALTNSSATSATYLGLITLGSAASIIAPSGDINVSNTGTITGLGHSLELGGTATGCSITSIIGTGSGTLTKSGSGTWTISGANTYTGTTTINGGILQLGASERISNSSNMILNGGIFRTGSSTGYNETVGTLTLSANSTIGFGTGSHTLTFTNSSAITWDGTLTITGWTGSSGVSGTSGKLYIGANSSGLTDAQLAKINFNGFNPGAQILTTGEIVPRPVSTGDFRSYQNGAWDAASTWERYNGSGWDQLGTGDTPPTGTGSNVTITIRNTHTITVTSLQGGIIVGHVIIETGGSVIINNTGQATVNTLTNNGTLTLNSDAYGTASLKVDTYSGNNPNVGLYLSGNSWHYISSPVSGIGVGTFFDNNDDTWDLAHFVENISTSSFPDNPPYNWQMSWVGYDGWSYYDEITTGLPSSYSMALGKGYLFWDEDGGPYTLTGPINTQQISRSITTTDRGVGNEELEGYNLLGNPFTCGIDLQKMFDDPSWTSAVKSVWFTINGESAVFSDGGITVPSGINATIPPMTGFFVQATGYGSISFPLSARAHSSTPRYKGDKQSVPLIRLSLNEGEISYETVVRFNEKATPGIDVEFDAPRFIASSDITASIYTTLRDRDYTINGLPFPETSVDIPVVVNILKDGNHTITTMELQELSNYMVTLTDKVTNTISDLRSVKEYQFSGTSGLIKDRFVLTVSKISTGIENPAGPENQFNIFHGFGLINIQPLSDQWDGKTGSVKLMDISGKTVRNQPNTEFMKNALIQLPSPGNGIYFVEIRSGIMRYVVKVAVK